MAVPRITSTACGEVMVAVSQGRVGLCDQVASPGSVLAEKITWVAAARRSP